MTALDRGGETAAGLLVDEWPAALGRFFISSRRTPSPVQPPPEEALAAMRGWSEAPADSVRAFFSAAFRLESQYGDFSDRAGDAETSVYILVYLCQRPELVWDLLRVFVPILRPGLWDDQFRYRLEFMFFEHAWEAVFDFDHLEEPAPNDEFDWAGSLNSVDQDEQRAMLEYSGVASLPNPRRPEIAPWNKRWFRFAEDGP